MIEQCHLLDYSDKFKFLSSNNLLERMNIIYLTKLIKLNETNKLDINTKND